MNAIEFSLAEFEVVRRLVAGVDPDQCEKFIDLIQGAKRIFVGGAGRSLLAMRMFAMRLMQTNHTAYMVGEVCTPSIRAGDLLIASSGRGFTPGTHELIHKAKKNGALTVLLTANPNGPIAPDADFVLVFPPAPDVVPADSRATAAMKTNLPINFFETVSLIVLDGVIARIMERENYNLDTIMTNHANLE